MIAMIGPVSIAVLAGVAFLLFGDRLPTVMRSLGEGIREFKSGVNDEKPEVKKIEAEKTK